MAGKKQFANVEEQKEFIRKNLMGPVDGIYLPPEQPGTPKWKDKIEQIRQMTLRDDDVLLLTYPKSGSFCSCCGCCCCCAVRCFVFTNVLASRNLYLTDGSTLIIARAATLRQKMLIKLAISYSHRMRTPAQ